MHCYSTDSLLTSVPFVCYNISQKSPPLLLCGELFPFAPLSGKSEGIALENTYIYEAVAGKYDYLFVFGYAHADSHLKHHVQDSRAKLKTWLPNLAMTALPWYKSTYCYSHSIDTYVACLCLRSGVF